MRVPLGVLDQSPVTSGRSPAEAIAETVELARLAEDLGYHRYWLAEHHAIAALADPSPEILVARVASATSRIRVGTGGVLMPYYSPLKIAEQFRMLEALFPGLRRRARRTARRALRVRALHQRVRGRCRVARVPPAVPALGARAAAALACLRVRDLRQDQGRGRAPRGERRSAAPAHGERHR